jgi:mannose-6-phosphate isomerase-like protein (cupin superfamily)
MVDLSQLTPNKLSGGVTQYKIFGQEQTVNRNASFELLVFEDNASLQLHHGEKECTYYLLSGRGTIALLRHLNQTRYTLNPDTAAWIPADAKHTITNVGEGPFRCLVTHCQAQARKGKILIIATPQFQVHELVGFVSRTIFSHDSLASHGASRTIGVDFETLTPNATLGSHEHEEEFLYVLSGRGFVRIGNEDFVVKPGSAVYTGPHIVHSVHNTENDNFQYLVYEFSP